MTGFAPHAASAKTVRGQDAINPVRLIAFVLAAASGLAILATTPPGKDRQGSGFDTSAAMKHVRSIASAPHPTGSTENARTRDHIAASMRALGMEVSTREGLTDPKATKRLSKWSGGDPAPAKLVNLVGVLPGTDRNKRAVMLMAHHDLVWGSPGAADDAAGVASALEVARQIAARGQPDRDLILLITDGEELGLQGAKQFFAGDPLLGHIGAVINMEARGGGGRTTLFETTPQNGQAIEVYRRAVNRPGANSLAVFVYSVLPNDTDLSEAMKGDWAAYNFAFIGRPGLYHSPKANPDRLDQGALRDMGSQVLELTTALLSAGELPGRADSEVFFDLFGLVLISYASWLGWPMLGIAVLALGMAFRRKPDLAALASGGARMIGLMIGAVTVLALLNKISGSGSGANYYDRLAAIPMLEGMALLAAAACFLLVLGKGLRSPAGLTGAAVPLLVMGAGLQVAAPTAAFIIVLPVMIAALGLAGQSRLKGRAAVLVPAGLAIPVIGYQIALGHQLMQGVGPTMPGAAALPLGLGALAFLPLWPGLSRRQARQAGLALLLLALGAALWVRLDPVADTVAVYSLAQG